MTEEKPVLPHTVRARRLRKAANLPERLAWEALRGLRTHGVPVKRQHVIAGLTVDFAIYSARLVIEIDGGVHALVEVQERDAARDAMLAAEGWAVVRIPARLVMENGALLDRVVEELRRRGVFVEVDG